MFQPTAKLTQAGPQSDTAIAFADRAGAVTGNNLSLGDCRGFSVCAVRNNPLSFVVNPPGGLLTSHSAPITEVRICNV